MIKVKDFLAFAGRIVSDAAFRAAAILDLLLYGADYIAQAYGFSFSIGRGVYEAVFGLGLVVAAYRNDVRLRETRAVVSGIGVPETLHMSLSGFKERVTPGLEAQGYEVKFPAVEKRLAYLQDGWEEVVEQINGRRYRIVIGDGERVHNLAFKRKPPRPA